MFVGPSSVTDEHPAPSTWQAGRVRRYPSPCVAVFVNQQSPSNNPIVLRAIFTTPKRQVPRPLYSVSIPNYRYLLARAAIATIILPRQPTVRRRRRLARPLPNRIDDIYILPLIYTRHSLRLRHPKPCPPPPTPTSSTTTRRHPTTTMSPPCPPSPAVS